MGKKKSKKDISFAEKEMASYADANEPDIHIDRDKAICEIIRRNLAEITAAKQKYLKDNSIVLYERYSECEASFYILIDDLRKEGLYVS